MIWGKYICAPFKLGKGKAEEEKEIDKGKRGS